MNISFVQESLSFFEGHLTKIETPNAKKRYRRLQQHHSNASSTNSQNGKSVSNHNAADDDGDENVFSIVSLDKQWFFEAASNEERDDWVHAIEQQILCSLQNIESSKAARAAKTGGQTIADAASVQAIKLVAGNGFCADCEQLSRFNERIDRLEHYVHH
jgi:Arf-GAP with GTPase, ANK repeat and PH domain-containing protein 1/3/4/5/6/9/11